MKKNLFRLLSLVLVLVFVAASLNLSHGGVEAAPKAAPKPKVVGLFLDGGRIKTDVPPIIENGRTLVPIRVISENLGMNVDWNAEKQEVTIYAPDGRTVVITIGKKTAYANGSIVSLDVPATIENGRTLVPIRFVAERFGLQVKWVESEYAVYLDTGGPRNVQPLTKEDFIEYFRYLNERRNIPADMESLAVQNALEAWDDWGENGMAYLRMTRIDLDLARKSKYNAEHPLDKYPPQDELERHYRRFIVEELLWAYYKGPIPASPYEKEVMDRVAKYKYNVDSWDKIPKVEREGQMLDGWNFDWAILLDYHFNEENKLDWFIFRPIGVRYAFKITIKDPIGSYVSNAGWAGFDDEKFNGVASAIATPEIFDEMKKSKVVISFDSGRKSGWFSGYGRATGEIGWSDRLIPLPDTPVKNVDGKTLAPYVIYSNQDFSLKFMEVYRWKNQDYMVKQILGGGDFEFSVGGYFIEESDLNPGSKILPDYFTERRTFTPGTEWRPWNKEDAAAVYEASYYLPRSWYKKSESSN